MQVDDRDLRVVGLDAVPLALGDVGPDDAVERPLRRQQPTHERVDGAEPGRGTRPHRPLVLVGHLGDDEVDEIAVRAQRLTLDPPAAVVGRLAVPSQRGADVVHDHRVLLAVVLRVGERERQQVVFDELRDRPVEAVDALRAAGDVGLGVVVALARRRVHLDRLERARDEPERAVPVPLRLVEPGVVVVEEEEVFALDVEDQRVRVGRVLVEHARVEQGVEEEGRVRRLRRDAGDPRDVDVRAACAVDEVEVGEQRLAVAPEPDRQLALHAVEEERLVARDALRPVHLRARTRRDVHLGLDAGRGHLRGLDRLRPAAARR